MARFFSFTWIGDALWPDKARRKRERMWRFVAAAEPQPDLAVLRPRRDQYGDALPGASEVLFIVEVADTSLAYDRDVKLPLYARYTIPEVWLVDLSKNTLSQHSQPQRHGYLAVEGPFTQGLVSCQGLEGVTLDVGELLS